MLHYKKYLEEADFFSSINIVPFTDVVLVLLIIFMVAAPNLLHSGLDVQLPTAKNTDIPLSNRVRISLDQTGNIYMQDKQVQLEQLANTLKDLLKLRSDLRVTLHADQRLNHGRVVDILDLLRSTGVSKIYVGTAKE